MVGVALSNQGTTGTVTGLTAKFQNENSTNNRAATRTVSTAFAIGH